MTRMLATVLAMLATGLVLGGEPTREELRTAERIALSFTGGDSARVEEWFAPTLRARLGGTSPAALRNALESAHGPMRQVQAAWAEPREGASEQAVVPIDFERGSLDLVLGWEGDLRTEALLDFAVRPRQPRPTPVAERTPGPLAFTDATYVDPALFTESFRPFAAPGGPPLEAVLAMPTKPPAGPERLPAVLLLPDRDMGGADGAVGPNMILRDLGRGLACRGIVTLRFAPRDGGASVEESVLADARAALMLLAREPSVSPMEIHVIGFGAGGTWALEFAAPGSRLRGMALVASLPVHDVRAEVRRLEAMNPGEDTRTRSIRTGDLELLAEGSLPPGHLLAGAPVSFWQSAERLRGRQQVAGWRGKLLYLAPANDFLATDAENRAWEQLCASPLRRFVTLQSTNRWLLSSRSPHPQEGSVPGHVSLEAIDLLEQFIRWDPGSAQETPHPRR